MINWIFEVEDVACPVDDMKTTEAWFRGGKEGEGTSLGRVVVSVVSLIPTRPIIAPTPGSGSLRATQPHSKKGQVCRHSRNLHHLSCQVRLGVMSGANSGVCAKRYKAEARGTVLQYQKNY
jgi:hypothetical protein